MIVDDEPLARGVIRTLLADFDNWQVVVECTTATEAWNVLTQRSVQVMFLDIQMPGVKGTDLLRSLKNPPLTIFTTAYSTYAVEGFELNAFDYLLKPINAVRFEQTIRKVEHSLLPPASPYTITTLNVPVTDPLNSDHIFVKSENRQVKVMFGDILFLEAQRDMTKLYLTGGPTLLSNFHLKLLEDLLPTSKFLRVHRSYLIALQAVDALNGNMLELEGYQVPIGGSFRSLLLKALKL